MWDDGKLFGFTCNNDGRKRLGRIFLFTSAMIVTTVIAIGAVQQGIEGS